MAGKEVDFQTLSPAQAARLAYDLQVQKIELEIRNEELCRAQEELAAARDRYADLYDYAPIAYVTADADGTIVAANLTAADLLHVGHDAMVGSPVSDFVARHDQDTLDQHRREVCRYGYLRRCELTMVKANGETFPAQLDSVISPDRDGAFDHCRTMITDVTERVRVDQALARLRHRESLAVLTTGIAHDFNNLLTTVLAGYSLANMDLHRPDRLPLHLGMMGKGLEAIRDLVQALLTLTSRTASEKTMISAKALLEAGCDLTDIPADVHCATAVAEELWPVVANERMLSRVIQRLVTNAIEAMPAGGMIRVTADNAVVLADQVPDLRPGRYVRLSVADAGAGISDQALSRIFDPYFSTKERGDQHGMGLGLAIAHAVVAEHGGTITVASRIGTGTVFHVYLPAAHEPSRGPHEPRAEAQALTGAGRILVMDDQSMVRFAACAILRRLGYTPAAVGDGMEAIQMYRVALESGERFAAVVLDLTVPQGMGGETAVAELLAMDPEAIVLVSSSYPQDPVMTDYARYGFRGTLPKPYDLTDLGQALRAALQTR